MSRRSPWSPESVQASMGSRSSASTLRNGYPIEEDHPSETDASSPGHPGSQEDENTPAAPDNGYTNGNSNPASANNDLYSLDRWNEEPGPWIPIVDTDGAADSSNGESSQASRQGDHQNFGQEGEPIYDGSVLGDIETDTSTLDGTQGGEEDYRSEDYGGEEGQGDYRTDDDERDGGQQDYSRGYGGRVPSGQEQNGRDDHEYEQDNNEEDQREHEVVRR